jgi:hypothetical protein
MVGITRLLHYIVVGSTRLSHYIVVGITRHKAEATPRSTDRTTFHTTDPTTDRATDATTYATVVFSWLHRYIESKVHPIAEKNRVGKKNPLA